jgi:DNA-binding NarL/FixJ family response regulator
MAILAEGLLVQMEASRANVLLLVWHLPGASMQQLLVDIRGFATPLKIVVLSVNPDVMAPAVAAGADAVFEN